MAKTKTRNSTKRFGARYGKTVKEKFCRLETAARKKYKCPECAKEKVKRIALGIWECGKCGVKFTSKAYEVRKKVVIKEEKEEEPIKEEKEEIQEEEEND